MDISKLVTIMLVGFAVIATLIGLPAKQGQADQFCIKQVRFESSYQMSEAEAAAVCGAR